MTSKLNINWLNKCRCGNRMHTVETVRGSHVRLFEDDAVKCNSCSREGVIQTCDGIATVLWETDAERAEGAAMTKSTITRERLEALAVEDDLYNYPPTQDELNTLARMALAAMDREPVAVVEPSDYVTAAQLVGEGPARKAVRELYEGALRISDKLYRHTQQAPVVPEEKPMPNPLSMYAVDAVAAIAEAKGWNACRAAMLQGKAEPVRLHPELSVWYGSMPESNGKSNWTAILHRKGECLSTGITIELSEYPERVRYEADRVRHIIGELKEEPDILDYDADEHSGYVNPGNSPIIPDGYVMVPKEPTEDMCFAPDVRVGNKTWDGYQSSADMAECKAIYVAMLAAAPHDTPALNSLQSVVTVPGKWIPVSERMPEDRISVILWDAEIGEVTSGHYSHKTQTFYHCGDAIENEITHWMPPPSAQQEEKP